MSRACSSAQGPKPPMAPNPRVQHDLGETNWPNANSSIMTSTNGDLSCTEEEVDQDNDFEDLLVTDKRYLLFSTDYLTDCTVSCEEGAVVQSVKFLPDVEVLCSNNNEAKCEGVAEGKVELMDSADTENADSMDAIDISDVDSVLDSTDGVEISAIECGDDIATDGCDAGEALADTDGLSECDVVSNDEGSTDCLYEMGEESCLKDEVENTAEESPSDRGVVMEQPQYEQEESCFRVLCISNFRSQSDEEDETSGTECSIPEGAPNGTEYVNSCIPILPLVECPYDVIGPSCDSHIHKRPGDFFQPYSVIDIVPGPDTSSATEFEANCDEERRYDMVNMSEDQAAATSKLYHVSSNYVVGEEENQANSKKEISHKSPDIQHSQSGPCEKLQISMDKEDVDDYADIDDSFCKDSEDQQSLECASSEDYVEIGDDEDEETNQQLRDQKRKGKDCEPASKQGHTLLNQLNSHPHYRLCSITVPANLDGRASELTNRVVIADTTDAFQEEIDFDGHIVPYYDGSDSERDNISDEHVYEEAGLDSEGENFLSLETKCMVTRSRTLSCKMPGYVPETVPEETGSEYQTHDYCTVTLDKSGDQPSDSVKPESSQMFPSSKPRQLYLYPRSFSVEGRDIPMSVYAEGSLAGEARMKRNDANLSLPCIIASSGSFSQRGLHPSSSLSTPMSGIEIPPPFELAYISKKPITKSSPSLLIESDSPDKQKKKSSFKRFLALKFKRKTENKAHVDVSIPSSRSSSESIHHGPLRVLDIDRRSMSSSPQLQFWSGMPHRSSDVSSTFLLNKDGPRRKMDPKAFSNRSILRVESFADRSRPPLMPPPLTKPRSISFPSADTSDYENIPAMSSEYENIQIQPQRPARAGTFGEYFDDPNRAISSANDTDGYVDMSSFTGFESKPQTPEQESGRYCKLRCKMC